MLRELIASAKEFERAGAWDDALARYEQAFAELRHEGDAASAADLLRWIGTVRRERGELELAGEAYEASLAIAERNGLDRHLAAVLNCLGIMEHRRGHVEQAEALYTRALERAVELEDGRLAAMLDQNLGALHGLRGDLETALSWYGSALSRSELLGETPVASQALNNMGMAHLALGNLEAAGSCFERALALAEGLGDRLMVGTLELNRAELHRREGRLEAARESCEHAVELFSQLKSKLWTAEAYKFLGILHRTAVRPEQANACFAMALGLAEVAENRLLQAESQLEWALVHMEAGRHRDGIGYLNQALGLFGQMQAHREVVDIRERLEKMEGLYLTSVEQWSAQLLTTVGPRHAAHAVRVAHLASLLADELGLDDWARMVIRVGALIHDVGYTALAGSGAGSPEIAPEAHPLLKAHVIAGDAIARQLHFPEEIRRIVRGHHERLDGSGFPDGLAGEAIAVPLRIVSIADAFDRQVRPVEAGRARVSCREALLRMRGEAGAAFDPVLMEAFERAVAREAAALEAA